MTEKKSSLDGAALAVVRRAAAMFPPRVPDHERTARILGKVAEPLKAPGYDQLRIGQLLEVLLERPGPDLFTVEDAALERLLDAKLAGIAAETTVAEKSE